MRFPSLSLAALALVLALPAQAQKDCSVKKSGGTLNETTYRQLERIHTKLAKNQNAEAEQGLREMMERGYSGYEKAIILQTLGFVYAQQEKYAQALKTFEEAVQLNALPQAPQEQLQYNIGQLYIVADQYDKGIKTLETYMAEACAAIPPDAHILLASAYAEKKRFREALAQTDMALSKSTKPKESWLQLKLALHYELKDLPKCAEVLVALIQLVPNKEDYWKQLSGVLFEIKNDRESLAVLALAERQGYIDKADEIKNLANIYMLVEIPYKAGVVLQRGIDSKVLPADEKNLQMLADAWLVARENEKALVALQRTAAVSDSGETWYRIGQIHVDGEKWKQALEAFDKAANKGVKKPGELNFLIGVAAYNAGDKKRAVAALQRALNAEDSRKNATEWLAHIQREEEETAAAQQAPVEPPAEPAPATN